MTIRRYSRVSLLFTALLLLLIPLVSLAQTPGMPFKLIYQNGTYTVSMTPNTTPSAPNLTLTAQVTVKVPHGSGADLFTIANLQPLVTGTNWAVNSRINVPAEASGFDYISFEVSFPTGNNGAFAWTANTEVAIFSFQNTGSCLGPLSLIENTDPFMPPNSAGTNPGNQIDIIGLGSGNVYSGNSGIGLADCSGTGPTNTPVTLATNMPMPPTSGATATPPNPTATPTNPPGGTPGLLDLVIRIGQPSPALAVSIQNNLPVTVTNQGTGNAIGSLQVSMTLPPGISAPASFLNHDWSCTTVNSLVTCANAGPLIAQNSSSFTVPITPDASLAGKITAPFTGNVTPVAGETNLANNSAAPMTPTHLVTDDSDGDGIPNAIEGANDFDHDTLPNYLDLDADNDGVLDAVEGTADRDGDGKPNYLDLDADNDGIPDTIEAQSTTAFVAPSGQDADRDGIDDAFQSLSAPLNTDRVDQQDYLDLDADNDGVLDQFEAFRGAAIGADRDSDGIDDGFDHVSGPNVTDGITNPALELPDTDRDAELSGNLDYRDPDDDGDGVATLYENPDLNHDGNPLDAQNTDRDSKPNYLDLDDDGDGVFTVFEKSDPNRDGNPTDARDTDIDGKLDYVDMDDDADGYLTANEQADPNTDGNPTDAVDTDKDGIHDYLDADSHPPNPNDDPKPVTLVSFTSVWQTERVIVRWVTSAEIDLIGFRLYRSIDNLRTNAIPITANMLASQGQSGGIYTFTDRHATPGISYTYWLAEVAPDNTERHLSSVIALVQNNQIFLPLLQRR